MKNRPIIMWFRRDLRLADNPALSAAHATGQPVIALFVLDDAAAWAPGAASRWWLHQSLSALSDALAKRGAHLVLKKGDSKQVVCDLVAQTGASAIFWNRRYYKPEIEVDTALKSQLREQGVDVQSFNGSLVRQPWEVKTGSGGPYRVFTPFWKSIKTIGPARSEVSATPKKFVEVESQPIGDRLEDWALLPTAPNWAEQFADDWQPGERNAHLLLKQFLAGPANTYDEDRNRPDKQGTSRLSPHLAWGEISPVQIWQSVHNAIASGTVSEGQGNKFLSEVVWRDFAYNLLYHYPELPAEPLKPEFAGFPWHDDHKNLRAWQRGQTGYPIIDAGMRQLWQTGWMHNRVRMITASFLIKDLLIRWQDGEAWFWDCLIDADLANNAASWQWVAGSGADAAPYFRIFNPITQGEKFDPDGDYIRKFVPELAGLPAKFIHKPWLAAQDSLEKANIKLGKSYPYPIVDHAQARKLALAGYDQIRNNTPLNQG